MCMDHQIMCKCGQRNASFNFKNEIMPPEIVKGLYCPECSGDVMFDYASMIRDNGWVIDYDMDIAELYGKRLPVQEREKISPELIFDKGYVTWRGVYPGDHIDSATEKAELVELSKINPRRYIEEFRSWSNTRMERLRKEGWRKAYEGERV